MFFLSGDSSYYSAKGAADEICAVDSWLSDRAIGFVVVRFTRAGEVDSRVNPVLVTLCNGRVWIFAKDIRSRLARETYDALVANGINVKGRANVTYLEKVTVDYYA